jgi:hypothetical protein
LIVAAVLLAAGAVGAMIDSGYWLAWAALFAALFAFG